MRFPTTPLLALLSTTSTIIPPVFAAVNESTDTAAAVKGINWLHSSISSFFWQEDESFEADESSTTFADADDVTAVKGINREEDSGNNDSSFSWQEDESIIAGDGTLRLSVSDSLLCKEEDIVFIERFLNTDEKHVGDFIQSDGKPDDQLVCLVDEFKLDYGDDELTTEFILKELMSTNYLESCRDREDLDECSEIFPIVKDVVDIVMNSMIPYLLEDLSDECQYEYNKKVYGEKYGECLAADLSFDTELIDIILEIDFENDDGGDDESKLAVVELFGLITDRVGAPLVLSDEYISISCDGDQSQRRLPFFLPVLIKGAVTAAKLASAAKKTAAAKVAVKNASTAIKGKPNLIKGVQNKIKGQVKKGPKKKTGPKKKAKKKKTRKPTRRPTQEPSKSPTQSPASQPSIEPSTSQPSIEPSSSANPSLSNQPSQNPSVSAVPSLSTSPSSQPSSRPSDEPSGQPSSSKPSMGKLRTSKSGKETKSKTGKAKCSKSKAGSVSFSNIKSIKREGSTSGKAKASKSKAGSGSGSFS